MLNSFIQSGQGIITITLLLIILALCIAGMIWKVWLSRKLDDLPMPAPFELKAGELEEIERDAKKAAEYAKRIEARAAQLRFKQFEEARVHELGERPR